MTKATKCQVLVDHSTNRGSYVCDSADWDTYDMSTLPVFSQALGSGWANGW